MPGKLLLGAFHHCCWVNEKLGVADVPFTPCALDVIYDNGSNSRGIIQMLDSCVCHSVSSDFIG